MTLEEYEHEILYRYTEEKKTIEDLFNRLNMGLVSNVYLKDNKWMAESTMVMLPIEENKELVEMLAKLIDIDSKEVISLYRQRSIEVCPENVYTEVDIDWIGLYECKVVLSYCKNIDNGFWDRYYIIKTTYIIGIESNKEDTRNTYVFELDDQPHAHIVTEVSHVHPIPVTLEGEEHEKTKKWLLDHEDDIASGFADYGELKDLFKFMIGREPVCD